MEPGKHQQNVVDSHWQGQLLPSTVSPLLPRPVSPWLSCSASPSLSHPMSPSLGHPCPPAAVLTPLRLLLKVLRRVMGWTGHVGGILLPPVYPQCAQHADPHFLSPAPAREHLRERSPALYSSPPHRQPRSRTPNPPGVPAAAEGGDQLGTILGLTPAKPHPCWVAPGAAGVDGAAVAEQRGMRAGAARKQRIKKRRNRIWASSRAGSLPPSLSSSPPFNEMK